MSNFVELRHEQIGSGEEKRERRFTHEIPPLLPDGIRLTLCDKGPHELGNGRVHMQLEVEREVVSGRVEEVDEPPADLVRELEDIVARSEGEDGMQRGDDTSARRKGEEIGASVRGQVGAPRRRGTGELLFEDGHVCV